MEKLLSFTCVTYLLSPAVAFAFVAAPVSLGGKVASGSGGMRMGPDPKKTVVVTGMGVVGGNGLTVDSFWASLLAGECSIDRITRFDTEGYKCQIGSELKGFEATDYFVNKKSVKSNDLVTQYAVAASRMALDDSGLDMSTCAERCGVMVGSAFGGMDTFEKQVNRLNEMGPSKVSPFAIPAILGNTAAGVIAIETGAKGPNFGLVSACATATHCLGEALQTIREGEADVMIAGGAEAAITPLSYAGFSSMKAMASEYNDNPKKASRPFDANRAGFVMAEGAGVLVLESLEHAQKRGAKIYCEIAGYGASGDAHHITSPAPDGAGLANAIGRALRAADMDASEVTYINAHGTSTAYNDKFETLALKRAFGEEGARKLIISSTKGMTGHALGAAGGLEAIICCKAIETGMIPPTINYETPDPDCDLNYTPNKAAKATVNAAMSNNLGFGGHNASILFRKLK